MSVPIPNQSVPPTAAIPPIAPNSYQETTIAKSEGTTVLSSVPNQSAPPASAVQAPQVPSETHIQQSNSLASYPPPSVQYQQRVNDGRPEVSYSNPYVYSDPNSSASYNASSAPQYPPSAPQYPPSAPQYPPPPNPQYPPPNPQYPPPNPQYPPPNPQYPPPPNPQYPPFNPQYPPPPNPQYPPPPNPQYPPPPNPQYPPPNPPPPAQVPQYTPQYVPPQALQPQQCCCPACRTILNVPPGATTFRCPCGQLLTNNQPPVNPYTPSPYGNPYTPNSGASTQNHVYSDAATIGYFWFAYFYLEWEFLVALCLDPFYFNVNVFVLIILEGRDVSFRFGGNEFTPL